MERRQTVKVTSTRHRATIHHQVDLRRIYHRIDLTGLLDTASHCDNPTGDTKDDRYCPHRQLLSSVLRKKSLPRQTSSESRRLAERLRPPPESIATGRTILDHRERCCQPNVTQGGQRNGGINWNTILERPDRLYFVEDKAASDAITIKHVVGGPNLDHALHEQRPEASSCRQDYAERASLKSMAPIGYIKSDQNRHRSNKAYWMLGKLGPDMQDPERREKQRTYARVKAFSHRVNQINKTMKQRPVEAMDAKKKNDMAGRRKAIEYSKSIPKPGRKAVNSDRPLKDKAEKRVLSDLQRLDREHQAHKERMRAIAAELHRRGM